MFEKITKISRIKKQNIYWGNIVQKRNFRAHALSATEVERATDKDRSKHRCSKPQRAFEKTTKTNLRNHILKELVSKHVRIENVIQFQNSAKIILRELFSWQFGVRVVMEVNRRVPPCAVKTCAVRPVFVRVVGELRAADPSDVHGPVKQNASPEAQSEAPRRGWKLGQGQSPGPENQDSQHMLEQPRGSLLEWTCSQSLLSLLSLSLSFYLALLSPCKSVKEVQDVMCQRGRPRSHHMDRHERVSRDGRLQAGKKKAREHKLFCLVGLGTTLGLFGDFTGFVQKNPRAHKNKIGTPPPPPKPPPKKEEFYGHGFSCRKNAFFPGVHKIGAAISGPRIADTNFTDTGIFLICPWDKFGEILGTNPGFFSLFYTAEARRTRVCPWDKPGAEGRHRKFMWKRFMTTFFRSLFKHRAIWKVLLLGL